MNRSLQGGYFTTVIGFGGRAVRGVGLAVVLALAVSALAVAGPAAAQTHGDIEERDRLIAAQEALLNTYRCLFGADVDAVPGGCDGGAPIRPPAGPGPAPADPTQVDIEERDRLIVLQELVLNEYRCQYSADTHLVSGG